MRRLEQEYVEQLEAQDPDVQEASRDWADNDGMTWRAEAAISLGFVVLVVSVVVLVAFFAVIEALVGR